ncbi:YdbH domain-containing protein [Pseudomonas sp.]|uniref:YdbH domain-containing protein n=1 Tax=Pseudomonas sp. TaxID=306 RepID=UPI0028AE47FB|nr:YdbH domain-containing protein [Pseudomonas sp.]
MTRLRRTLLYTALGVLLALLLSAVWGAMRWEQFKREAGIVSLDVHGLRVSTNGIALRQFVLTQAHPSGAQWVLAIDRLQLQFARGWSPLPLQALRIAQLDLAWRPAGTAAAGPAQATSLPDRQELQRWAAWIPRQGRIDELTISMPCVRGTCRETGSLRWRHGGEALLPATLDLGLRHGSHRVDLSAAARQQAAKTLLDLQLRLDDRPRLSMQNQLARDADLTDWRGSLSMSELPEAPWLLEWLGDWVADTPTALPELPGQMHFGAGWAVTLDGTHVQAGEVRISANLPAPWPVIGLGQLQGQLELGAQAADGQWIATDLAADLSLRPGAERVAALPAALRPSAVRLVITPEAAPDDRTALPLKLQLAASGPSPLSLSGQVLLQTQSPYAVTFNDARLNLRSPAFTTASFKVTDADANLRLAGTLSQQAASLRFDKGSRLSARQLTAEDGLSASQLLAELTGTTIELALAEGRLERLAVKGHPDLTVGNLKHPLLRPQGWRWNGNLTADATQLALDGPLDNSGGLSLPLALRHSLVDGATRVDARLPELFLRAGNPLAATLADWPTLLELNNGRLQGQAHLEAPAKGTFSATASLSSNGVGGIYDRTEFGGLDAALSLRLQRDHLQLELTELSVREVNPGFTFGPLRFAGRFAAPLDNLAQGRLSWETAEARLLGGRLWLDPGSADLAAPSQQLNAHLRGLQLPRLLEAYPTEGLSGTGVIDGELQLQRSAAGISIEQGSLKAREPGGALQFRSAKIQALGQSNPAMRLVTEALDDFHYDLLASDVHYAADGKLDLGLRLQGRNPALEGGRPINFSINLEENIPALLTSLQLSDRVSETIQRRVQEQLRKDR